MPVRRSTTFFSKILFHRKSTGYVHRFMIVVSVTDFSGCFRNWKLFCADAVVALTSYYKSMACSLLTMCADWSPADLSRESRVIQQAVPVENMWVRASARARYSLAGHCLFSTGMSGLKPRPTGSGMREPRAARPQPLMCNDVVGNPRHTMTT